MPRSKNIREIIAPIVEELCVLYDETNPVLGEDAELEKLQNAQLAFDIFWKLYGELMIWAQNQIIGYEHARDDGEVAELVAQLCKNGQIHENAHPLEVLGAFLTMRIPYEDSKAEDDFEFISNNLETHISDEGLRKAFIKMLLSEEKGSFPIRDRLKFALESVSHGQTTKLFTPSKTRRRGQPYMLDQVKSLVIMHLSYMEAKGFRTYRALELIGDKIAVSPETIRTWKKELSKKDWFRFQWNCGRIAGKYQEILLSDVDDGSDGGELAHESEEYGPFHNIFMALEFLQHRETTYSLEKIKKDLNKFRE